ncbi:sigma intracellular receptor 2 [Zootoca vivipara]|uniref:sigma intracellular receptor 2 n=1 Tax=Zootoca vivipara TaxID=8524 RepID=UPI001590FAD2|nr:sigma intracellular receptor 2 [Zootoca vivipara]
MAAGAAATRLLEWIFAFYFLTHIPITLLVDLQSLPGAGFYPRSLKELTTWYTVAFKDPMMQDPPAWFRAFIFCEAFLQLPFFPIAAYAFWKGNCKWIRIPAIIYATHVMTTLLPIFGHVLFNDFSRSKHPAPQTLHERLTLCAIYSPYFLIPCLILLTMLLSPLYNQVDKRKKK